MKENWLGRKWTAAERQQVEILRDRGMSYPEIGKLMGRSVNACIGATRRCRDSLKGDGPIRETDRQRDLRIKLYGEARYA
jgi:DNA-directed RNA polymerase specialized sigma24 family protein